jgi:cytochrome c oxidase cbb3-type subunit 3
MKFNKNILFALLAIFPVLGNADVAAGYNEHFNPAMIISWIFIILIILFTIVIYILGKVLVSSTRDKMERKMKNLAKMMLFPVLLNPFLGNAAEGVSAGMGFTTDFTFWYLLVGILLIQLCIIITFAVLIRNNMKTDEELASKPKTVFSFLTNRKFWNNFNKSTPVKEEKSILLDHDYDGIKELDNDLPPWWKYGFYASIIWAVGYMFYYHVSSAAISSAEEYENEIAQAEKEVEAYRSTMALNVDENTVTVLTEKSDIDGGAAIYAKNCVACHAADGGGGIGPNFTDKHWMFGGAIGNIFKTIKYGANNGMKAWENDFSPVQIQQVSSYILSLQGTTPAEPKAPQGELYDIGGEINSGDTTTINNN